MASKQSFCIDSLLKSDDERSDESRRLQSGISSNFHVLANQPPLCPITLPPGFMNSAFRPMAVSAEVEHARSACHLAPLDWLALRASIFHPHLPVGAHQALLGKTRRPRTAFTSQQLLELETNSNKTNTSHGQNV